MDKSKIIGQAIVDYLEKYKEIMSLPPFESIAALLNAQLDHTGLKNTLERLLTTDEITELARVLYGFADKEKIACDFEDFI